MNSRSMDALVLRYASFGLLFVACAFLVYLVRGVLPVFLISGVIAFALEPLLQRLERNGRSRPRAVGYVFLVYVLLILVALSLLANGVSQGQSFIAGAPKQLTQIGTIIQNAQKKTETLRVPGQLREGLNKAINGAIENAQSAVTRRVPTLAQDALTITTTLLINAFLITLISFGLMLEAQRIKGRLLLMVPAAYRRDVTRISASINELLGRYVRGQLIVCGTYGLLCTIAFEVLARVYGLQYPLVLGVMAAFIYILPYFGLAVIIAISVSTAYFTANPGQGLICAGVTLGCCVAFNLIVDYGVAPRVLGRGVGLHPLMVIFALVCGFELGGPLGTIAAVPIFASLRVIAIYLFPQLAAPLPDDSPEKTSVSKPHSATSEMGERLAAAQKQLPGVTARMEEEARLPGESKGG